MKHVSGFIIASFDSSLYS